MEEVDKCRTTLTWTYAIAYYLGNETCLFQDNQRSVFFLYILLEFFFTYVLSYRDLERAVEDLSLFESPIKAENIPLLRQQVTNTTVCLFLSIAFSY